jgi:hypothetical protein
MCLHDSKASAVAEQKFVHLWYEIKSGCQL